MNNAPKFIKPRKAGATPDQLRIIRDTCLHLQTLQRQIEDTESRAKELRVERYNIERKTLPDLLNEAGVSSMVIESTGNQPEFSIKKEPYYKANIVASWPFDQKQKAFDWLTKNGGADLIKTEFVVRLPMRSTTLQKAVKAALRKLKVDFTMEPSVPWGSLTAFVKECYQKHKVVPLEILGADVGEIVKLKEHKE